MKETGIKKVLAAGALVLACGAGLATVALGGNGGVKEVSTSYEPTLLYESILQAPTAKSLSADSSDWTLADVITYESYSDYESNPETGVWHYGRSIHGLQVRWDGEMMMYSSDGGTTWAEFTLPDRDPYVRKGTVTIWGSEENAMLWFNDGEVTIGDITMRESENTAMFRFNYGDVTLWDDEGAPSDFDLEIFRQRIVVSMPDILSEVDERITGILTEISGVLLGNVIARQVDGVWEFSHDYGETWTTEMPEGLEIIEIDGNAMWMGGSQSGSQVRFHRESGDSPEGIFESFNIRMFPSGNHVSDSVYDIQPAACAYH